MPHILKMFGAHSVFKKGGVRALRVARASSPRRAPRRTPRAACCFLNNDTQAGTEAVSLAICYPVQVCFVDGNSETRDGPPSICQAQCVPGIPLVGMRR